MANYGRPKGSGGATTGGGGAAQSNTGVTGGSGGGASADLSKIELSLDLLVQAVSDLSTASATSAIANPEIIKDLSILSDQALLVFAGDYKAYYNLYADGTAIIRVSGLTDTEYGTLEILGDIELGDEVQLTLEPYSILNIGY